MRKLECAKCKSKDVGEDYQEEKTDISHKKGKYIPEFLYTAITIFIILVLL